MSDLATILVTIAAVGTAVGVLGRFARLRPVRWIGRRLVGDPLTAWFRREVAAVVDERLDARPLTNGEGIQHVLAIRQELRELRARIEERG